MMLQFTRTDGRVVSINPAHVRLVDQYGNNGCILTFSKDHFITITDRYQNVVNLISSELNKSSNA